MSICERRSGFTEHWGYLSIYSCYFLFVHIQSLSCSLSGIAVKLAVKVNISQEIHLQNKQYNHLQS